MVRKSRWSRRHWGYRHMRHRKHNVCVWRVEISADANGAKVSNAVRSASPSVPDRYFVNASRARATILLWFTIQHMQCWRWRWESNFWPESFSCESILVTVQILEHHQLSVQMWRAACHSCWLIERFNGSMVNAELPTQIPLDIHSHKAKFEHCVEFTHGVVHYETNITID